MFCFLTKIQTEILIHVISIWFVSIKEGREIELKESISFFGRLQNFHCTKGVQKSIVKTIQKQILFIFLLNGILGPKFTVHIF